MTDPRPAANVVNLADWRRKHQPRLVLSWELVWMFGWPLWWPTLRATPANQSNLQGDPQ